LFGVPTKSADNARSYSPSTQEATMSILGGLVDEHHETELNPSTRLVTSNWFVRHFFAMLAFALMLAAGLGLGAKLL
jgi:hypothetical protein